MSAKDLGASLGTKEILELGSRALGSVCSRKKFEELESLRSNMSSKETLNVRRLSTPVRAHKY